MAIVFVTAMFGSMLPSGAGPAAAAEARASSVVAGRTLGIEERVAYQRAVEEVYWRHRTWPAVNPQPKPALDELLPRRIMDQKVEDGLRLSAAFEALRGHPITGDMLQAELERQARDSRRPDVLRELWSALGNDAYVIAEVLARPLIAERFVRSWYDAARRPQVGTRAEANRAARPFVASARASNTFEEWWDSARGDLRTVPPALAHAFRLPEPDGDTAGSPGTWTPTFSLPEADLENTAVWTGAEMIVWGGTEANGLGKFSSGARYDPATDTWRPTSGFGAPEARKQHSAVWTGTEMIVWGGCGQRDEHMCEIGSGGRYDPLSDTWQPTSLPGDQRMNHTAVWTGTEMIVWGGCAFANDLCRPDVTDNTGLRYDPGTDTWQPTSRIDAPGARHFHTAVWTGDEMIVWGGRDDSLYEPFRTGGRYDPATDTWRPTTLVDAPAPRYDHTAVWGRTRMIVWGGSNGTRAFDNGRRYDPVADRWLPVPRAGAPSARTLHTAVWDGGRMIVWGGCPINDIGFCTAYLATGGRYDPSTNTWTPTALAGAPEPRADHLAVWSGSETIVWGGNRPDPFVTPRTGGRYNPVADTWRPTNAAEAPTARVFHTAVWTGVEMIVWGGTDRFFGEVSTGSRYDPATDSWRPTQRIGAPGIRHSHTAIWTGAHMIVWGGGSGSSIFRSGGRYDPAANAWTPTSTTGTPVARSSHSAVWTGTQMIVWGGSGNTLWMNTGGRYDPSTDTWSPTTTIGAPRGRDDHGAVWTGNRMIVWAGNISTGDTNTGGSYDPLTDSWTPTSSVGAPEARASHATVWTGTRMLVWGGSQYTGGLTFDFFRDGGLYDPLADAWTPTSLANAPSERASFSYVWTGDELIVWAGCSGPADCSDAVQTGGQYSPATDSWIATPLIGSPSARNAHEGVWTGSEMLVWGGVAEPSHTYTHHGGRYLPIQ
jgi:N-acetylneuraminic acid mutarotase